MLPRGGLRAYVTRRSGEVARGTGLYNPFTDAPDGRDALPEQAKESLRSSPQKDKWFIKRVDRTSEGPILKLMSRRIPLRFLHFVEMFIPKCRHSIGLLTKPCAMRRLDFSFF